ncbi:MAG: hypothetical protein LBV69_04345 [Bacteroidales bacterium]|jgi:hypothetical protein|nr:hypothetical protein [Bacteroidales bacterium]
MQREESQAIIKRFFEAIYELKRKKVIRGKQTFTKRYSINNRNLWVLEQNHASDIMQIAWLGYLVSDYGISAEWLILGVENMFKEEPPSRKKFVRSKNKKNV